MQPVFHVRADTELSLDDMSDVFSISVKRVKEDAVTENVLPQRPCDPKTNSPAMDIS